MPAENKTKETTKSVTDFINSVKDEARRKDAQAIAKLMKAETGFPAKMWGPSIVGFGNLHYVYDSGREGDMPLAGFSPRASEFVFYLSAEFPGREEMLAKLGKHKTGKGCVYIKKLEDVDVTVLKRMVAASTKHRATRK